MMTGSFRAVEGEGTERDTSGVVPLHERAD
jgi:hypothetical protein